MVRIGLCSSENLSSESTYFAGPNHPALGELVLGEFYYINLKEALLRLAPCEGSTVTVKIAPGHTSMAIGQKKKNRSRLLSELGLYDIRFIECDEIDGYGFEIERGKDI